MRTMKKILRKLLFLNPILQSFRELYSTSPQVISPDLATRLRLQAVALSDLTTRLRLPVHTRTQEMKLYQPKPTYEELLLAPPDWKRE